MSMSHIDTLDIARKQLIELPPAQNFVEYDTEVVRHGGYGN